MAGRKPTPTKLKMITGNPGKRPIKNNEPQPQVVIPAPPAHMEGAALEEWRRISKELHILGLISEIDSAALAAYCQCYGRWVEAETEMKSSGLMVKTTNGNVIQSPLVGIANKAMMMMHKFLIEFGMTPSSRTRVGVTTGQPQKSKFGDLISKSE